MFSTWYLWTLCVFPSANASHWCIDVLLSFYFYLFIYLSCIYLTIYICVYMGQPWLALYVCVYINTHTHTHTHTHTCMYIYITLSHTYTHIQDLIRISVGIEDINDLIADLRYVGVSRSLFRTAVFGGTGWWECSRAQMATWSGSHALTARTVIPIPLNRQHQ